MIDKFKNFVSEQKAKSLKKAVASKGDVIVTHRGTIGQISFIPDNSLYDKYVISQSQFRVRFKPKVTPYWVTIYFLSPKGSASLLEKKGHTGVPAIAQPTTTFRKLSIPYPTLAEQKAIATALSDVDDLISSLDQLIQKKKAIKQGAMQELLTGKTRLPGFKGSGRYQQTEDGVIPEEWGLHTIESLTPSGVKYGIVDGPFGSNLKTEHYKKRGIPIITSGYVTNGYFKADSYLYVDELKFKQEKRSAVKGGDIVMAKIGARCGASAILPLSHEVGILSGNALKISIDEKKYSTVLVWQFLQNLYQKGELEGITSTGAQPAISMSNLKIYEIPLPPTLAEQKAIATVLSDMDTEIEALQNKKEKYQRIKQGMMQELLTGKTRLI